MYKISTEDILTVPAVKPEKSRLLSAREIEELLGDIKIRVVNFHPQDSRQSKMA